MTNFKVIIPVYNSELWVSKCLDSVISQEYKEWQAVVIDDNSTDKTVDQIKNTLGPSKYKNQFKVLKRSLNVGAMENIVYGISVICKEDNDIVVLVDGDDWLASCDVFSYLNKIYEENQNIRMTYGSFESESGRHNNFCKQILSTKNYRKEPWVTSHLRTFKCGLWKKINDVDLKDASGKYYSMSWDRAIMYPLIEMSGLENIKYIDKIMYMYNDNNPINDFRKNTTNQLIIAEEIKNKKPYLKV